MNAASISSLKGSARSGFKISMTEESEIYIWQNKQGILKEWEIQEGPSSHPEYFWKKTVQNRTWTCLALYASTDISSTEAVYSFGVWSSRHQVGSAALHYRQLWAQLGWRREWREVGRVYLSMLAVISQ